MNKSIMFVFVSIIFSIFCGCGESKNISFAGDSLQDDIHQNHRSDDSSSTYNRYRPAEHSNEPVVCYDWDPDTEDVYFYGKCFHTSPGECGPFAVRFSPFKGGGWWNMSGRSRKFEPTIYTSQPGECSIVLTTTPSSDWTCVTPRGETPLRELPAAEGLWGCMPN